jgi:hypothetical protein
LHTLLTRCQTSSSSWQHTGAAGAEHSSSCSSTAEQQQARDRPLLQQAWQANPHSRPTGTHCWQACITACGCDQARVHCVCSRGRVLGATTGQSSRGCCSMLQGVFTRDVNHLDLPNRTVIKLPGCCVCVFDAHLRVCWVSGQDVTLVTGHHPSWPGPVKHIDSTTALADHITLTAQGTAKTTAYTC